MRDTRMGDGAAFLPGAAILGAAIGAAAALLMAPSSGERTRKTIARKGEQVAKRLIDEVRDAVDKCEGILREHRGTAEVTELHSELH
jgi:gas vesicle protein